jgi:hypothetical protein
MSLPENTQTIELADVNGDGADEVAVASTKLEERTRFGVVESGEWSWCVDIGAAVHAATSGEINGNGDDEVIFRSKFNGSWVRPYAHPSAEHRACPLGSNSQYIWHGQMKGWPDQAVTTDFDEDGRAEVVAVSNDKGVLTVWDDDGTTLWEAENSTHVEGLLGLKDVVSDPTPELLTHAPRGDGRGMSRNGLQLVRRAEEGGVTQVWKYRSEGPFVADFVDQQVTGPADVIAVSLETGRVHGVDGRNGTTQWTEPTGLRRATDAGIIQSGHAAPSVVIWRGATLHRFDTVEKTVTEQTFNTDVRMVHSFTGGLVIVTNESIEIVNHELETITSIPAHEAVKDVGTGDIDGDRHAELVVGFETELVAYKLPAVQPPQKPRTSDSQRDGSSPSTGSSNASKENSEGPGIIPTTEDPDTSFRAILGALGVGFFVGFFVGNTENKIVQENLGRFVAIGSLSTVSAALGSFVEVLLTYGFILASLSAGLTIGMIGGLLVRNRHGSVLSESE